VKTAFQMISIINHNEGLCGAPVRRALLRDDEFFKFIRVYEIYLSDARQVARDRALPVHGGGDPPHGALGARYIMTNGGCFCPPIRKEAMEAE
jgi:hypothetical protein